MKKLTKYNRVAGYLEQIFRLLNQDFFEGALSIPVITIQSTPTAYGHVTVGEVWVEDGETMRKKPSSTRKYQCPKCGNSIRATKDVNILCMDCNEQMLKV